MTTGKKISDEFGTWCFQCNIAFKTNKMEKEIGLTKDAEWQFGIKKPFLQMQELFRPFFFKNQNLYMAKRCEQRIFNIKTIFPY
jgi:hypothetical protein